MSWMNASAVRAADEMLAAQSDFDHSVESPDGHGRRSRSDGRWLATAEEAAAEKAAAEERAARAAVKQAADDAARQEMESLPIPNMEAMIENDFGNLETIRVALEKFSKSLDFEAMMGNAERTAEVRQRDDGTVVFYAVNEYRVEAVFSRKIK